MHAFYGDQLFSTPIQPNGLCQGSQDWMDGRWENLQFDHVFLTQGLIQAPSDALDDQVTNPHAECGSSTEQRYSWVVSYILGGLHVRVQRLRCARNTFNSCRAIATR